MEQEKKNKRNDILKKITIGLLAGVISGFFTSGGGMIVVPAFIYMLKIDDVKARATSLLCILPMVVTSGIIYWKNDLIDWRIGMMCAAGGIVGGIIGSKLLVKLSTTTLKIAFTIFLVYSAIRMIF